MKRYIASFAVGLVLVMVAGDLTLSMLPLPEVEGNTNRLFRKWYEYQQLEHPPDIVVLGSSYEEFGVEPAVLDATATALTGTPVTSFNLAAPATSLNTERLLVRRLVRQEKLPELVYLGITPFAVDTAQTNWLRGGLCSFGTAVDIEPVWRTDRTLVVDALGASVFRAYNRWNDIQLIGEKTLLGQPLTTTAYSDESSRGWRAWRGHRRLRREQPTDKGTSWRRFDTGNINGQRIRQAIAELRRHGVAVRLLELPLASTALTEAAPSKNQPYQAFVQDLLADTGVTLVRPPAGLLQDSDYFDGGHLLPKGAEKLSRWMATDAAVALAARNAGPAHERLVAGR